MNPPTERQPKIDATSAPSAGSGVDETAAVTSTSGIIAAPGFGPPAAAGEVGTLGPYRVVKELGKGGMGAVYAAIDTRLDRRLALKVMLPQFAADPSSRERFLREARAAARIKHDNVVTVYEADERNGVPYIAMEYLEGYPLDEFLKKKGNPTPAQVLKLAAETAAGLAAAHRHGLVHRDVKPGNLWLEAPAGRVKVLDFGLAKPIDAEVELTKSGAIVGTPAYMSPEQARGEKVDHRTDLFSLGAVLYRLCTGRLPFQGQTTMAVLMALGMDEPPPVRDVNPAVPEELAALVHQLLAKSADARPQSADEVVKRVRAIGQGLTAARARAMEQSTSQPQVIPSGVSAAPMNVTAHAANPFADLDAPETELESAAVPEAAPVGRAPRGKMLAVAAGLAALVLMVFGGVIIVIRNRDGTETKIEVPDGATVTVKGKDGKTLATVGPGGKPPAVGSDPDRTAADYTLSVGGGVRVNGQGGDLRAAADLPKERFTLTWIDLGFIKVTDAGLAHFKDCEALTGLHLYGTQATDAGLANFKGCKGLTYLYLGNTKVSDAGLATFKGCKGLTYLHLGDTQVSDAGLVHIQECKNLKQLHVDNTKVSDAGLLHIRECKNLTHLYLGGTQISDAGLAHVHGCKSLTHLNVKSTKVTAAGLARFHAAVPGCKIEHDGGVIEAVDVDRKAAEYVVSVRGGVTVQIGDGNNVTATAVADLPRERFTVLRGALENSPVTDAGLANFRGCAGLITLNLENTQVTDAGLPHLTGVNALKHLFLSRTSVTDAGLAHLRESKGLMVLHLGQTKVTDAGLAHLAELPALTHVNLHGTAVTDAGLSRLKAFAALQEPNLTETKITDAGLTHLKDCPKLTAVVLGATAVTDAGLIHLKDCPKLTQVVLTGTAVTDAGLDHLKGCTHLADLNVVKTKVTAKGLADFHAAVPGCRIEHDGGVIEAVNADRAAAEYVLSVGGRVGITIDEKSRDIIAAADLPRERFTLHTVILEGKPASAVTPAAFVGCAVLKHVSLNDTPVEDAHLAHLKDCTRLGLLELSRTKVTGTGLAHLAGCTGLTDMNLDGAPVTDAGLASVKSLGKLHGLGLARTAVTDAGLAHFRDCKTLAHLSLEGTKVTDAGLAHLREYGRLTNLSVRKTKVTAKGLADFHAAVPGCRIEHDGGVIEVADADRRAAEYVLSVGGAVRVNGEKADVRAAADLPKGAFALTWADLWQNTKVTDDGLANFKGCKNLLGVSVGHAPEVTDRGLSNFRDSTRLTYLNLSRTNVTPAGLDHFRECADLAYLDLYGTATTDAAVPAVVAHKNLTVLGLGSTKLTDAGLARLTELKKLTQLNLQDMGQVTDASLVHVRAHPALEHLALSRTSVTDAGVVHLKELRRLTTLILTDTKVTAKGLADFHAAVPGCRIEHDGGVIEAEDVDRAAAEYVLSVGGSVGVKGDGDARVASAAADLPKERFVVTSASLEGRPATDAGLAVFKGLPKLEGLFLQDVKITDTGLAHVTGCKALAGLSLHGTAVTDAGMVGLKNLPDLRRLSLQKTALTDAGLDHLSVCKGLENLDVRGTRVTAAGLARFHAAVPACRIEHDGGVFEPKK